MTQTVIDSVSDKNNQQNKRLYIFSASATQFFPPDFSTPSLTRLRTFTISIRHESRLLGLLPSNTHPQVLPRNHAPHYMVI